MIKQRSLNDMIKNDKKITVGIIGAMDQEVEILRDHIENRQQQTIAGYDFYTGSLAGLEVVLLKSGIGKVNAAVSTALLLHAFSPDCIINTGSAGGFDPALNVGDIVISSEVRHHDVDVTIFGYEPGQVPGLPAAFMPDATLAKIAEECIHLEGVQTVHGLIATGDSFMNDPLRVAHTRALFPRMKAVEMEAAAIAQTCYQFATPFIVIRALSDIAGKQSHLSFDQFLDTAATNSAEMVIKIVRSLATL